MAEGERKAEAVRNYHVFEKIVLPSPPVVGASGGSSGSITPSPLPSVTGDVLVPLGVFKAKGTDAAIDTYLGDESGEGRTIVAIAESHYNPVTIKVEKIAKQTRVRERQSTRRRKASAAVAS